jgi:hypothetical protein
MRTTLGYRLTNLAGRAAPHESPAALAECRLYVRNDSGSKRLAVALPDPSLLAAQLVWPPMPNASTKPHEQIRHHPRSQL